MRLFLICFQASWGSQGGPGGPRRQEEAQLPQKPSKIVRKPFKTVQLQRCIALQCFSDGGFVQGVGGAAGVPTIAYSEEGGRQVRSMGRFLCMFDSQATSAFQTELLGHKIALELVAASAQ